MTPVSVVVPAHNEEGNIARCVRALTRGAEPGEVEVVVVPNGCTDRTAEVTRGLGIDGVHVVELAKGSKVLAINEGERHATRFPRFYVDGDVELHIEDLRRVASLLADPGSGVLCAAPRPHFDLTDRPWAIREYYKVWTRLPFLAGDPIGNGVYALSEAGRARWKEFPMLTADDEWVRRHFSRGERRAVHGSSFTIRPPKDLGNLVKIRTRVHRGNAELRANNLTAEARGAESDGPKALIRLVARRPTLLPGAAVYAGVTIVARVRARRAKPGAAWERDSSTRTT
jgi:glycosyltransferase involved in cell wall biosynthesis